MREHYDVIVIGGGHAGTEAAWAAASALGEDAHIALITMDPSRIGQMSCNPAIGGLAKGQIVREIDALGGIMGLAADASGIMFKMLNMSKGAAVRGPRCQADKYAYPAEVQRLISTRVQIDVIAGSVEEVLTEGDRVIGVKVGGAQTIAEPNRQAIDWNLSGQGMAKPVYPNPEVIKDGDGNGISVCGSAVVLTTGTFMRGLMHVGEQKTVGGRMGEQAAVGISGNLMQLGFSLGRLKTGTPPRLDKDSLDWDGLDPQRGDDEPQPFSDLSPQALPESRFPFQPQIECRITHTTAEAHEHIRANLHRAPMYSGQIDAECGPRYCPSVEDKVVRFPDRTQHHVFLEPESLYTSEIYANGIPTSLPEDVQKVLVHTMPGCENARILKWGYAVEYDMVRPHQIDATCMTKRLEGLFLAGQINGTSGYEEAGGQGLIAGLNAARFVLGKEMVALRRDQAYIGVMLDDLVTKTPREPYRMFTSRAEHRLMLRACNADLRLTPWGRELGLIDGARWQAYTDRAAELDELRQLMRSRFVNGKTLWEIARRPDGSAGMIRQHLNGDSFPLPLLDRIITEAKYEGYIARQQSQIRRQVEAERQRIPEWIDPRQITGLRAEAVEALATYQPQTMGQAGRLEGINPADLTLLAVAIRRGPGKTETAV